MYSKTSWRSLCVVAVASVVWTVNPVQAHQIWLEQNSQGATLYFGEFGDNLRETSPGLLDKFGQPEARKIGAQATQPLTLRKTASGFVLSGRATKGESLVVEDNAYPISEWKDNGNTVRSLYQPAARLATQPLAQPPRLTLDLVPTGNNTHNSVQVQAFFKGQPLPKAKVALVTASGWAQEHHTDATGKLTVVLPWRGTYVLELGHNERTAGQRGDDSYDRASYVTSLTLVQAVGLPALPAAPASPPNP